MARFAFTLEDKNVLDETTRKIEVVGHKINEGGGKGKFMKAIAFDPPDRPLEKGKQYTAQWKKAGEEWQLINIEPHIEIVPEKDRDTKVVLPTPPLTAQQGRAFPEPQTTTTEPPTYEEVKTKILKAVGDVLDMWYVDLHLGMGRKK